MDERIIQIIELCKELDKTLQDEEDREFDRNFDAFEFPSIVSNIIRFLQPLLEPYEAAIYWHMFNVSIIEAESQNCFVSTRGLMNGVIQSSSGQGSSLSIGSTRKALAGLENKGAILRIGEPTRTGTPYKVLLPEEIPTVAKAMREAQQAAVENPESSEMNKVIDYYNIKENRKLVFERDSYKCHYCQKQLTRFTASLDHIQPISKGGDNSMGNLVTSCIFCNSRRGNRPVSEFLSDTES